MKIKISKSQWEKAGQKAGWLKTSSGLGRLDKDTSDVFEAKVMMNRTKSPEEIANIILHDVYLSAGIAEAELTHNELISYIQDVLRILAY